MGAVKAEGFDKTWLGGSSRQAPSHIRLLYDLSTPSLRIDCLNKEDARKREVFVLRTGLNLVTDRDSVVD